MTAEVVDLLELDFWSEGVAGVMLEKVDIAVVVGTSVVDRLEVPAALLLVVRG